MKKSPIIIEKDGETMTAILFSDKEYEILKALLFDHKTLRVINID